MSTLYVLVVISICVASFFLAGFIWSVKNNQYEDKEGAAMRMLHENDYQGEEQQLSNIKQSK